MLSYLGRVPLFIGLLLLSVFLFLRFYNLDSSLLFSGDMGRDYQQLWEWSQDLTPPLLGPQTSAIAFYQSPIYFYLLMPVYVLSGGSLLANNLTVIGWFLIFIAIWMWIIKMKILKPWQLLILLAITSFQPEMIEQLRLVWNPSLLFPLLITGLVFWIKQQELPSWTTWAVAACWSLAISLNYSVIVVIGLLLATGLFIFDFKKNLLLIIKTGILLGLWLLPLVVFEFRHGVLLNTVLNYEGTIHTELNPVVKTERLLSYAYGNFWQLGALLSLVAVAVGVWMWRTQTGPRTKLISLVMVLVVSLLVMIFLPVSVHSHYVFGLLAVLSLVIIQLPHSMAVITTGLLCLLWLPPILSGSYWQPAFRSLAETQSCGRQVCQYLDNNASFVTQHASHTHSNWGVEWRYLLNKNGCNSPDIYTDPEAANKMVVFAEQNTYIHSQTTYDELNRFGSSEVEKRWQCADTVEVIVLNRDQL